MRGNFVNPIGNPYYEPDYEKYHYDPLWYDRWQDPETYHGLNQFSRSAARAVGPFLPFVAAAAPLGAAYYTIRENYNKLQDYRKQAEVARMEAIKKAEQKAKRGEQKAARQAEEAKRADIRDDLKRANTTLQRRTLLAEKRALKQAKETNEKIGVLIEELKKAGIKDYPAIMGPTSIPLGEVEMDISPPPPEPDVPAPIPSYHVDLPEKIYKISEDNVDRTNRAAEEVVRQIREYGYDRVIDTLGVDNPFRVILEDIPSALTGPNYFPEPFYAFLDKDTRKSYKKISKLEPEIPPESRGRERLRTPSRPPERPSFNVQLPDIIRKAPNTGTKSKEYSDMAKPIAVAIDKYGLEPILADKELNNLYPDIFNILRDPRETLVSDQQFPQPFLKYLTTDTQEAYKRARDKAKTQDAKTKRQARAAAKKVMFGKPKKTGEGIIQSLINPSKKRRLL